MLPPCVLVGRDEDAIEVGDRCAKVARRQVRLPQGHGQGGVPEELLKLGQGGAFLDRPGRERLAEIVEPERGVELRGLHRAFTAIAEIDVRTSAPASPTGYNFRWYRNIGGGYRG